MKDTIAKSEKDTSSTSSHKATLTDESQFSQSPFELLKESPPAESIGNPAYTPKQVLYLQRVIGNHAVQRLIAKPNTAIQRQLEDDEDEDGPPTRIESGSEPESGPTRIDGDTVPEGGPTRIESGTETEDAPSAETGTGEARRPSRVGGEDTRTLEQILAEAQANGTSLVALVRLVMVHEGQLAQLRPYVESASASERESVLWNTQLVSDARAYFNDADFQALETLLRQTPAPTSPEITGELVRLRAEHLRLREFLERAFTAGAHFRDVASDIANASAEERQEAGLHQPLIDLAHSRLGDEEHQDLLIALGAGVEGGSRYRGMSPAEVDTAVRGTLGRYLQTAIQAGVQIAGHVAIVTDADWDRVGIACFGAREWATKRDTIAGFVHEGNQVFIRTGASSGTMIHEAVHLYSQPTGLSGPLEEGITEYYTQEILRTLGQPVSLRSGVYTRETAIARDLISLFGEDMIAQAYFNGQEAPLAQACDQRMGQPGTWDSFKQAMAREDFDEADSILRRVHSARSIPVRSGG